MQHATSVLTPLVLCAMVGLLWWPIDASMFRGRISIVDGMCKWLRLRNVLAKISSQISAGSSIQINKKKLFDFPSLTEISNVHGKEQVDSKCLL